MFFIWNIIALLLLIIEATTVGFIYIFFSIGCFISSLVSLLTPSIGIQVIIMCITSIVGIIYCRKILQKHFEVNKEIKSSNINAIIGKNGIVTKAITSNNIGLVKVEGEVWSAISIDSNTLVEGTNIIVAGINGVKLIVRKLN